MFIFFLSILVLFFLLSMLSLSRNLYKEHFNKITVANQDVPFDLTYDIPFDKNIAFAICDKSCDKFVEQEWRNQNQGKEEHGWKPFGYWNGDWSQQRFEVKYKPKYRLLCGCNIEY